MWVCAYVVLIVHSFSEFHQFSSTFYFPKKQLSILDPQQNELNLINIKIFMYIVQNTQQNFECFQEMENPHRCTTPTSQEQSVPSP